MNRLAVATFTLGVFLVAAASGAQTRGITAEDYFAFESVSDPHFSPDGSAIAFVVTTVDQKQNRRASAIWMVIGLLAIALMFSVHQRLKVDRGALMAATTSALYVCGIYLVYLSTPHDDLTFYLFTSASRTMATASVALLVSLFFLLSGFEAQA